MFWAPKKVNSWETLGIAQGNLTAATHVFMYCVTYKDHAINKLLSINSDIYFIIIIINVISSNRVILSNTACCLRLPPKPEDKILRGRSGRCVGFEY